MTTLPSTTNWRAWWREQSKIDGTDWQSLHRQLTEAYRALRGLAEKSSS
jgi:hypothetical protein